MEDYLREFRGYVDGILKYTFPLHWIDEILCCNNKILVHYYDEMLESNRFNNTEITEIEVDYIDIK